ncbi:MAG: dTMP kinase [Clostridia bacterium]|nr:dTMP kinase [Clostridia bacterium]
MLTELRLLLLEDADADEIKRRLPAHEYEALCAWHGKEDGAIDAFLRLRSYDEAAVALLYKPGKNAKPSGRTGRFIVLEGLDGAGKTTHMELLRQRLSDDGRTVYATAEPTVSAVGGLIRDALAGLHTRSASELAALFLCDRIQHNVNPKNGISGFLQAGTDVICDRYYYSSLAYQGIDSDISWVAHMNLDCPEISRPDACIFLDLPVKKCIERMENARLTTEIYETEEIIKRVKRRFADTFRICNDRENIYIVNADRDIKEISDEIYNIVKGIK